MARAGGNKGIPAFVFTRHLLRAWQRSCCSQDETVVVIWNAPRFHQTDTELFRLLRTRDSPFKRAAVRAPECYCRFTVHRINNPSIGEGELFSQCANRSSSLGPLAAAGAKPIGNVQKVGALGRICVAKKNSSSRFHRLGLKVKSGKEGTRRISRRWELANDIRTPREFRACERDMLQHA